MTAIIAATEAFDIQKYAFSKTLF